MIYKSTYKPKPTMLNKSICKLYKHRIQIVGWVITNRGFSFIYRCTRCGRGKG